ncbi:50S ribosomal protein L19 [Candidatus Margulisiibacteriota bacterium]
MSEIIKEIEQAQMKEKITEINVGDTVSVSKIITEGKKQRTQKFEGIVVKMKGSSSRKSITVRKIIDQIGVEKSFLLHSKLVPEIKILKRGKVRRAKLNYLRQRIGAKATRVKTKTR